MLCQLPLTPLNEAWTDTHLHKKQKNQKDTIKQTQQTQQMPQQTLVFNNTIQNHMKSMSEEEKHSYIESLILNDINNQQKIVNVESFSNLTENKDFKMFLMFIIAFLIIKSLHD